MVVDTFVSNDTILTGTDFSGDIHQFEDSDSMEPGSDLDTGHHNILVCTGANACGKVREATHCQVYTTDGIQILECVLEAGLYPRCHQRQTEQSPLRRLR
jgi:hypothetical protein